MTTPISRTLKGSLKDLLTSSLTFAKVDVAYLDALNLLYSKLAKVHAGFKKSSKVNLLKEALEKLDRHEGLSLLEFSESSIKKLLHKKDLQISFAFEGQGPYCYVPSRVSKGEVFAHAGEGFSNTWGPFNALNLFAFRDSEDHGHRIVVHVDADDYYLVADFDLLENLEETWKTLISGSPLNLEDLKGLGFYQD